MRSKNCSFTKQYNTVRAKHDPEKSPMIPFHPGSPAKSKSSAIPGKRCVAPGGATKYCSGSPLPAVTHCAFRQVMARAAGELRLRTRLVLRASRAIRFSGARQSDAWRTRTTAFRRSGDRLKPIVLRCTAAFRRSGDRLKPIVLRCTAAFRRSGDRLKPIVLRCTAAFRRSAPVRRPARQRPAGAGSTASQDRPDELVNISPTASGERPLSFSHRDRSSQQLCV